MGNPKTANAISFENFDKFSRKPFAERLTKVISTFYPFADGGYVLSLNASFGSGKTIFLKMWRSLLETSGYKVIYLNAWETDFDDEPLVQIANSLIESLGNRQAGEKAKKALQGVIGVAALAGNAVLDKATGLNVLEIMEKVEFDLSQRSIEKLGQELSGTLFLKKKIYDELRECLTEYVSDLPKHPLVILVDELDRVRPDYAVRYLETIKHIFSIQGICFVLAVDRRQLEASVRQLYGVIDFDNYYRRFITREADLTEPANVDWEAFVQKLSDEYFNRKEIVGIKFVFSEPQKPQLVNYIANISCAFRFTPRQAENLFRIFSQFMAVDHAGLNYLLSWFRMSVFVIAVLISGKRDIYFKMGNGLLQPSEMLGQINALNFSGTNADRFKRSMIYECFGFILTEENGPYLDEAMRIFISLKYASGPNDRPNTLRSIANSIDHHGMLPRSESGFQSLYKRLEEWRTYID